MAVQFSNVLSSYGGGFGESFSTRSVDLSEIAADASPVVVFDNFRVKGRPFGPHPHAGFSAITYVLEDSEGLLHNRDSLGHEIVMGPGGIVWLQAGRGAMHEETTHDDRELHGLQIFVNLSSKNKMASPTVFRLTGDEIPKWRNQAGDRVRVVVGSYEDVSSPIVPIEPLDFLDVALRKSLSYDLRPGYHAFIYVVKGNVTVNAGKNTRSATQEQALVASGSGEFTIEALHEPAQVLILCGARIDEPVLMHGSFIMSEPQQVVDAVARFKAGEMGHLEPRS